MLYCNWNTNKTNPQNSNKRLAPKPLHEFISDQLSRGTNTATIVDHLISKGYRHAEIKRALEKCKKQRRKKLLNWSSPTAITETARIIRNDIRNRNISYAHGMTILIKARNLLLEMLNNKPDKRTRRLNYEIKKTKNLLMKKFANPMMVKVYQE